MVGTTRLEKMMFAFAGTSVGFAFYNLIQGINDCYNNPIATQVHLQRENIVAQNALIGLAVGGLIAYATEFIRYERNKREETDRWKGINRQLNRI